MGHMLSHAHFMPAIGMDCPVQVGGRILRKRIHVRVEHIVPSRCREDFLKRRTEHESLKKDAKAKGGAPRSPAENLHWCYFDCPACYGMHHVVPAVLRLSMASA